MEWESPDEREDAGRESAPTWLDLYDYRLRVAAIYHEGDQAMRAGRDALHTLERFRSAKDDLFATHPQSPLSPTQRKRFEGLRYFPYNADMRVEALLLPEPPSDDVITAADGPHTLEMRRAARLHFEIRAPELLTAQKDSTTSEPAGQLRRTARSMDRTNSSTVIGEHEPTAQHDKFGGTPLQLVVYWIDVYGGGLFLPFTDATCPDESYGGGRYLFDTIKGSDFIGVAESGQEEGSQGYPGRRIVLDFNYAYNPSCAYDSRWVCPLAPRENRLPVPIHAGEMNYASG